MKCVLMEGLWVAFMKGLHVLHVFELETGALSQVPLPLTAIAIGKDIPSNIGWRLVNAACATNAKAKKSKRGGGFNSRQRPRPRN